MTFQRGDRVLLRDGVEGLESERGEEREGIVVAQLPDGSLCVSLEPAGVGIYGEDELLRHGSPVVLPDIFEGPGVGFGEGGGGGGF